MPSKVYTPKDFPTPKPDQFREELKTKVAVKIEAGEFERIDDGVKLRIEDSTARYTRENLIDFQTNYATLGGWKSVTLSRSKASNLITIELLW